MVKVIYVDQSAGKVTDSQLNDLIAKGEIAAFYGSDGWVDVRTAQRSGYLTDKQNVKERGGKNETAGSKGNSQTERGGAAENE